MNAYVKAITPAHIEELKHNLRQADRREVTRFSLMAPEEAIDKSIENSEIAFAGIFTDGTLAGLFGAGRTNLIEQTALLWFLGTDAVTRHPIAFYKASKTILDMIMKAMTDVEEFYNFVDTEHLESFRWIERLGGTFGIHDYFRAPGGGVFRRFYLENPYFKEV